MAARQKSHGINVPFFWPMQIAEELAESGAAIAARNLKFIAEEEKLQTELHPTLATANTIRLDLRTLRFCEYGGADTAGIPTIVDAPYAGHSAMIADYHQGQSLIETLRENGVPRVYLTDWKSATPDMKDFEIDQYLAELVVCIDDLGGRANLVGLCQGGWMAAMLAARFPEKVQSLVLAGSPIDTAAGHGPLKHLVHEYPLSFYEELVAAGGGLMLGRYMLEGWKNMHPGQHYVQDHIDLYEHIDDPVWLKKTEVFESWYEHPINLPGRWYLQAITQLFKENHLARGSFVGLGRRLSLHAITCPLYLLAGEADDITPREQVFAAAGLVGTPATDIRQKLVPGGHIGLFMGARTLREHWPDIARWIASQSTKI
jgi:poly(3-hydroxyalkanoate) synthetase